MNTMPWLAMLPFGAMLLGGCAHEREFRVAYVGSEGSAQIAGDEGGASGSSSAPVVAAGNAMLGPAGRVLTPGGSSSPALVRGSVTSVLTSTNQTLVQLTNGATVLLNGTGATLGDLVAIDLSAGRVVGGSTSLVGTTVLNTTGTLGKVTATPLQTAGKLVNAGTRVGTSAVTSVTAPVRSTTSTVTSLLTKLK